ncbi:hypothetical protein [Streptomyces goshikiensis]|uniref:hypothetical protein n=1 Tax=Streptomyces goshikiensis TaxID=1942 RepID=UPI002ADEFF68|nr:hypothetical protein [Streptomyces goshikiensis]
MPACGWAVMVAASRTRAPGCGSRYIRTWTSEFLNPVLYAMPYVEPYCSATCARAAAFGVEP